MKLLGRQSLLRTVLLAAVLCADPSTSRRARKGHSSAPAAARESRVLIPQLRSFPGVLSEEQCEQLIAAADDEGKQFAGATTFGLDSLRDSDIRWLPREHASVAAVHRSFAKYTRSANEDGWGWPLTRPETHGLQFAKYEEPHGGYDWHVDAVPQRDRKGGKQMVTRMVTLVAQLSDPHSYTGGDLQVGAVNASRERGTLHVFPSSMAHKVWPTTAGTRWSVVSWNGGVLEDAPHYFAAAIDSYTHMLSAATQDSEGPIDAATPLPTVDTISSWKKLLARTYTFVGKLDEAEAAYEAATLLTPEDMAGFNNLGTCRVKQGKYAEAIVPFERALALDPEGLQPLTNVGSIYMKAGRLEDGVQVLERAVMLHAEAISDEEGRGLAKADDSGPGRSRSLREAFHKLSLAATTEKDFAAAAMYSERLLVVQESLYNATKGRGSADHAAAYSREIQSTLAKLGLSYVHGREHDRAQQSWKRALVLAEANGDSASVEKLQANLKMLAASEGN